MNLAAVSETLLHQLPSAGYASKLRKQRRLEKFGDFAWNSFALSIIVSIGALIYHVVSGVKVYFEWFVIAIVGFAIMCVIHRALSEKAVDRGNDTRLADGTLDALLASSSSPPPDASRFNEVDTKKLIH